VDFAIEQPGRAIFRNLQPLVLASESPRRMQLLHALGVTFEVAASGVEEEDAREQDPIALVGNRAREKAQAVSKRHQGAWVLSGDTVVALHNRVFGKPANAEQAVAMLQELSGREHQVFTAVCLMRGEPPFMRAGAVRTDVRFRTLSDAEIRAYVRTGEPFDKAGSYGIQGMGAFLVESVHGSYTNVVGLPLVETLEWLLEEHIITPVLA
jgi:septum formation protein